MDIDGKRRSDNFEDRGHGSAGGSSGSGGGMRLLSMAYRKFGFKGVLVAGVVIGGVILFAPDSVKQATIGSSTTTTKGSGSVCDASPKNSRACDFSRAVLASTEDVWNEKFSAGELPDYGKSPKSYEEPTLVIFANAVNTGGCGSATSAVGPFYCPADKKLYIDPNFYDTMASRLNAPGDFAQAYVIAHEVGHHVQNLIGSSRLKVRGESKEQVSVRVELQADCLAGVWGHAARKDLSITNDDLAEATGAAHAIGDDALGHKDEARFTHGSSEERIRWFRKGFDSGDPRECDTFAVKNHKDL